MRVRVYVQFPRALLMAVLAVCFFAQPLTAAAQHLPDDVIRKYAPILWPAVDELVYPTLPHPFAFDGIDNDGDCAISTTKTDCLDLADADEVNGDACCFEDLLAKLGGDEAPERRVLYEGPRWFTDHGAAPAIAAIQYWFYYPHDLGLGSHPGDAEHVFVFVEVKPGITGLTDASGFGGVKAVVGAGHEEHTANNILVAGTTQINVGALPRRLPDHMPILIELAKHASAPDRNLDGRFDKGMDANVFRDNVWGSRDIFNLNVAQFFSPFASWYSFPRDPSMLIFEEGAEAEWPKYVTGLPQLKSLKPPSGNRTRYRLFPMSDLRGLYDALKGSKAEVETFLTLHRACFWPPERLNRLPETIAISGAAFKLMQAWPSAKGHERVFEHPDFARPAEVFKLHLFPTIEVGYAFTMEQDEPSKTQGVSVRLAGLRVPGWMPMLGGVAVLPDSTLELYMSGSKASAGAPRQFHDAGFNYRYYRGSYGGVYGGMSWRRERVKEPEVRSGFELGYGISMNLSQFRRTIFTKHVTVGAQLGMKVEPFGDAPTDADYALGMKRRARLQFRITAHYGLKGPRHPLTY